MKNVLWRHYLNLKWTIFSFFKMGQKHILWLRINPIKSTSCSIVQCVIERYLTDRANITRKSTCRLSRTGLPSQALSCKTINTIDFYLYNWDVITNYCQMPHTRVINWLIVVFSMTTLICTKLGPSNALWARRHEYEKGMVWWNFFLLLSCNLWWKYALQNKT